MTCWSRRLAPAWTLALLCAGAGCSKAPPAPPPADVPVTIAAPPGDAPTAKATMTISASADVNPDAEARPSPVVVRIYQLRGEARFRNAEFLPLFDEEKMVLAEELITRDEFVLAPSERRTLAVTLTPATRFVGALAAFRDFRSSEWRAIVPAPRSGLIVSVERTRVVLTAN